MDEARVLHEQLLTTKFFVPSSSHPLIGRPQLNTLLNEALRRKLTLISAPAGFGKTTLVSAWARSLPQEFSEAPRVAWVSLDEGDNDPVLFWTYALTALDREQPGLCAPLLAYLHTQQGASPPLRYLLHSLINTLASRTEQFLLVLDDYHVITEQEIHTSLTYLVEHLPPQLHLVLATRADPPWSLAVLRACGQVLEVRTNQLRCTQEEVAAFFEEVMGVQLTADIIGEVTAQTEGWLVGLQLLGLSLQGHTDPADLLHEVSGSQRYILEYLLEEVLRRQPPTVQTMLLRTSILERFSASLCDAVTKQTNSQELLEFLERTNAFIVPLDGQRRWYRYHALFAEALLAHLKRTEGDAISALHLRASCWFSEHGYITEAIRHAISAGDWERSADLIEKEYTFLWGSSEHALVRRWLEKLPEEVMRTRPRLSLAYAKTLFMVAPFTNMERWLHDAERALRTTIQNSLTDISELGASPSAVRAEWDELLGEIAAYRALITGYYHGDGPATLALCQDALTHLSPQNLAARATVVYAQSLAYLSYGDIVATIQSTREAMELARAVGDISSIIAYLCRMAYSLLVRGKLHEVQQMAEQAIILGTTQVGLPHPMVCWAYIYIADILRQWNRLDEALDSVLQAVRLGEQTETIVSSYLAYTELMRIYLARGEMDAACNAFHQAEAALVRNYHSLYRRNVYVIVDWVQFCLASGAMDRTTHWAEELAPGANMPSPLARERQDVAQARILLAQKRPTEVLSLLEPLHVMAEQQQRLSHNIEMKVLQALAYQMHQQEQGALSALAQAVRLAEPEGYVRIFADEGAPMAALLSRLREQEREHGPTPYVDALLAAFRPQGMRVEHRPEKAEQCMTGRTLRDPLSEREREVLRLLMLGDSNQEIAETLVLSINTIKRHVSNIFSKLGVHTRPQAMARASALALLSDEPSRAGHKP